MLHEATQGWTDTLRARWDRIARHDFEPGHRLDFTRRLARDRGWPIGFARGAVMEYRRFCFLAVAVAPQVTPSEEVDEVWHQHLTYSRDYWEVWCPDALGMGLHHEPTQGSDADRMRYRAQYASTLALYEVFFGPPEAAFWPATHLRFAAAPRYRIVDAASCYVLPRPSGLWRRIAGAAREG